MKISNTLLWFNLLRYTYYHRKVFHNWSCKKSLHNLQKINTMSILRTAKWKSHCTIIFWTMHHNWRWIVHCVSYTDHIYIYIVLKYVNWFYMQSLIMYCSPALMQKRRRRKRWWWRPFQKRNHTVHKIWRRRKTEQKKKKNQ